jgi:transposase
MGARKQYSEEFKRGAVKLVTEQGYTIAAAAQRLDVDRKCLVDWMAKLAPEHLAGGAAVADDPRRLQEQLRQLRKENERLRAERDILKKAAAYFAKETP